MIGQNKIYLSELDALTLSISIYHQISSNHPMCRAKKERIYKLERKLPYYKHVKYRPIIQGRAKKERIQIRGEIALLSTCQISSNRQM